MGGWDTLKDESTREKSKPNPKDAKNRLRAISVQHARPTQTLWAKVSLWKPESSEGFILKDSFEWLEWPRTFLYWFDPFPPTKEKSSSSCSHPANPHKFNSNCCQSVGLLSGQLASSIVPVLPGAHPRSLHPFPRAPNIPTSNIINQWEDWGSYFLGMCSFWLASVPLEGYDFRVGKSKAKTLLISIPVWIILN